jgi:hypothetical protein
MAHASRIRGQTRTVVDTYAGQLERQPPMYNDATGDY